MKWNLVICLFSIFLKVTGQSVEKVGFIEDWGYPPSAVLSNDGGFVRYSAPSYLTKVTHSTVKSLKTKWRFDIPGVDYGSFSPDSKYYVFKDSTGNLNTIDLITEKVHFISKVKSYKLLHKREGWVIVFLNGDSGTNFCIWEPVRHIVKEIKNVEDIIVNWLDETSSCVLLKVKHNNPDLQSLLWVDLNDGSEKLIWTGQSFRNYLFSANSGSVAFFASPQKESSTMESIWFYKPGMPGAEEIVDSIAADKNAELFTITTDQAKVFFKVGNIRSKPLLNNPSTKVDIWSYTDYPLHPLQQEIDSTSSEFYVVHTTTRQIIQISNENTRALSQVKIGQTGHLVLLIEHAEGEASGISEQHWNRFARNSMYVVSADDGSRKLVSKEFSEITSESSVFTGSLGSYSLSPDEKYVIYYDYIQRNYICFDIHTGAKRNITNNISGIWTSLDRDEDVRSIREYVNGIAGWTKQDNSVLLYDQYDIFKCDPRGINPPTKLTQDFGRKNGLQFRIAIRRDKNNYVLASDDSNTVLIKGFDPETKKSGFYSIRLDDHKNPVKLSIDACEFGELKKAKFANVYLVQKSRADFFPNVFYSYDLKEFSNLTNYHPEKTVNWLTSELITWKQLDGQITQGILYKPQNFDSSKKYPVIFYYYERLSDGLHHFLRPVLEGAYINIPVFVTNGYLVVVADIHFKLGNPGQSAYNSIVACARLLSQKSWVNTNKLALNGHSYGGYMTNYIVSHTKLFAAAISASGWSNFISASNRLRTNGRVAQDYYEVGKQRMGGSLWQTPGNYITASPIFQAHNVNTPLLMMNNKEDHDVDFYEGVQFFTALRRLGKRCWMLQYDGADHALFNPEQTKDFMIREKQFFDHYLKDSAAPVWMTRGIPAKLKGTTLGYEYDTEIKTPPEGGLLTDEEKRKVEALQHRKPITITIK